MKINKSFKIILFVSSCLLSSCLSKNYDNDGNSFNSTKIGDNEWMSSNLNTSKFSNGDEIYQAKTAEEWKNAGREERPAWCYYKFNSSNEKILGKLYNWYAVYDIRGIAPENWHVATNGEWKELSNYTKNNNIDLYKINFNPISSGFCSSKGIFFEIDENDAQWWCYYNKKQNESFAWGITNNYFGWAVVKKAIGLPVRCVKNK